LKIKVSAKSLTDLLTQKEFLSDNGSSRLTLAPYQYLWLK